MSGRLVFHDGDEAFINDGVWSCDDPAKVALLESFKGLPRNDYSPDRDWSYLQQAMQILDIEGFYTTPDWLNKPQDPDIIY